MDFMPLGWWEVCLGPGSVALWQQPELADQRCVTRACSSRRSSSPSPFLVLNAASGGGNLSPRAHSANCSQVGILKKNQATSTVTHPGWSLSWRISSALNLTETNWRSWTRRPNEPSTCFLLRGVPLYYKTTYFILSIFSGDFHCFWVLRTEMNVCINP